MAESFEEICANIKACLNSSQRQISLSDLNRDYHSVLGSSIPFRSFGHRSLEQFIRSVPDLKITQIGAELFVDAKLDAKTAHITNLVRGQKTGKKKPVKNLFGKPGPRRPPPPRRAPSPPKSQYRSGSRFNAPRNRDESASYPSKNYSTQSYNRDFHNHGDQPKNNQSVKQVYKNSAPSYLNISNCEERYVDLTSDLDDSPEYVQPIPVPESKRNVNVHITSGNSRKVFVSKQTNRHTANNITRNNSMDEDYGYSSMPFTKSYSKHSSQTNYVEDNYSRKETRLNDPQNQNPRRGTSLADSFGEISLNDLSQKKGQTFDNFRVTIKNHGPRDYIKLFYEESKK